MIVFIIHQVTTILIAYEISLFLKVTNINERKDVSLLKEMFNNDIAAVKQIWDINIIGYKCYPGKI